MTEGVFMKIDILLLALISGHLVGEFCLQSDKMAEGKRRSPWWRVAHAASVTGVTWILVGSVEAWPYMLPVILAHVLVGTIETALHKKAGVKRALGVFLVDQSLHLVSLVLVWLFIRQQYWVLHNYWVHLWGSLYTKGLILVSGSVISVWAIGIVLQYQMEQLASGVPDNKRDGLPQGGKIIGLLERTLVLAFVLIGKPEGVGFVVAAKAVFRIGTLTNHDDRVHAEYILIGTLRSFTYALIAAYLTKWLLTHAA